GMGLPGDYSSASRFVRAAFVRTFAASGGESAEKTVQFFRMMGAVQIPRGVVRTEQGAEVYTRYTVCYTPEGQCCCSTYENPGILAFSFADFDRDSTSLQTMPLCPKWTVHAIKPAATS
ncbi:MAG: linear amide C-N hydrolase, partial [Clostridia bacterium]|nr:linear amide C-N hydrolase [Clostridia bacterium]